jgi:sugar fermentation stimulation protein A
LAIEGIETGIIEELQGYKKIWREVRVGTITHLDLSLDGRGGPCFVEARNVTLAHGKMSASPDATSERGTKHLKTLIRLNRKGHRAALGLVIQRSDCRAFRPVDEIDLEYGRWLRRAERAGVEVLPYRARVSPRGGKLEERLPLEI